MSKNQKAPFSLRLKGDLRNEILNLAVEGEALHSAVVRLLTLGVQTAKGSLKPAPEVQIELSEDKDTVATPQEDYSWVKDLEV